MKPENIGIESHRQIICNAERQINIDSPLLSHHLPLPNGQVHIWLVNVSQNVHRLDFFRKKLSRDEIDKVNKTVSSVEKTRVIISKGVLRLILGCYLHINPVELRFALNCNDKPVVAGNSPPYLMFNTSHSNDYVIYAFAAGKQVGIDIELVKSLLFRDQIVQRFFSKYEIIEYFGVIPELRNKAFFTIWSRKEAFVKATGYGLSMPLDSFSLLSVDGQPILKLHGDHDFGCEWTIQDILIPGGQYVSALAFEGDPCDFKCWILGCA